jgi:threonine synthase
MDISVASNFERLLYDFYLNRNSKKCSDHYTHFPNKGIKIDEKMWKKSSELFLSYSINDDSTYECMKHFSENFNYIMDPHTAVAAKAVIKLNNTLSNKTVILSTAHPAKFPIALENAEINLDNMPKNLEKVLNMKEVEYKLNASEDSIFDFIKEKNK